MRRIPDDNLAYAALLQIGERSGTSFFLNSPGITHLVTAHHVLFDAKSGASWADNFAVKAYGRNQSVGEPQILMFHIPTLVRRGKLRVDPIHDVAVAEVARSTPSGDLDFVAGVAPLRPMEYPVIGVPRVSVLQMADVTIANEVYLFGYPVSVGLPDIPQIDYDRPLLRRGIVAGKNSARGAVIIDCPVYPGNSGGPVMQLDVGPPQDTFRVFGVAIEFVPALASALNGDSETTAETVVNSGYAVVSAMDHVLALTVDTP